jgi:hypothetical protein
MDASAVPPRAGAEGIEVEGLQGAFRDGLLAVMGDEQPAVDEPDIGLDAVEAVVKGIEQRPRVGIIIVRMRAFERPRRGRRRLRRRRDRAKPGEHQPGEPGQGREPVSYHDRFKSSVIVANVPAGDEASQVLSSSGGPTRIRTWDQGIMSPLL